MSKPAKILICLAVLFSIVQLLWFGFRSFHQIDIDGITYTALARELRLGLFYQSLNAFRSPLISWLIALVAGVPVLYAGKLVTIATFVLASVVLYVFTRELWHSDIAAGIAVLLFVLARGVAFLAVAFVSPDLLLCFLVLLYFLLLLRRLRSQSSTWFAVGAVHGIAFLAKAIALPWLALCTCVTALLSPTMWKVKSSRIASAALVPIIVAGCWAVALHGKYGVFMTGSQFRVNLFQWTLHGIAPNLAPRYRVLTDISESTDEFMAGDPMPPHTPAWAYHPLIGLVARRIIAAEARNVPKAAKETVILATPGILLAVAVILWICLRDLSRAPECLITYAIAIGTAALLLAYSMLVIDTRYFYPILLLLLAIGSKVLIDPARGRVRVICWTLVIAGVLFTVFYWASPFRVETRDWKTSCYAAGKLLRRHTVHTVVSIGIGPFPEHGVGWEAGYLASYYGDSRLVATSEPLPADISALVTDLARIQPDAVIVWDRDPSTRTSLRDALGRYYTNADAVTDSQVGVVGLILYHNNRPIRNQS